jgi:hypothetical protein
MTHHIQAIPLPNSSKLKAHLMQIGHVLYGTQERTWATLSITFVLLVLSIAMMQNAASGGACVLTGI